MLSASVVLDPARVSTSSSYFEVRGSLRLGDRVLEERSLVQRRGIEVVAVVSPASQRHRHRRALGLSRVPPSRHMNNP
jgi:general secretion pathway protein K